MLALKSNAWDLGIYNQAMYTFVFNGKLFFLTPEALNNPGGSLFGIHFSPIFFLQAPVYLLYPHPETLLVLQSFALGLGAVPTYLIAKKYFSLGSRWPLLLSFAYLVNPAILSLNIFDFHPEVYIPAFFLFTSYFYLKRNWKGTWLFVFLLLSTIEYAAILIVVFAAYYALKDIIWPRIKRKNTLDRRLLLNIVVLAAVSSIWLVLSFKIIAYFNPYLSIASGQTENWSTLGATSLMDVPGKALLHPMQAVNALTYDGISKMQFLIVSSISWIGLSLFSLEFWFLGAPMLLLSLLSSSVNFYTVGGQYSSFLVGPITIGGILVVSKLAHSNHLFNASRKVRVRGKYVLVGFFLFGLVLSNPFVSLGVASNPWAGAGTPVLSDKASGVNSLLTLIPADASVLTDSNIFPLVSSRLNAYTLPFQIDYNEVSFFNYVSQQVDKVNYILIDPDFWQPWPAITALVLSRTQDFGVIGYENGVLALKRGYIGDPLIFQQPSWSFNCLNVYPVTGCVTTDLNSTSTHVLERSADEQVGSDFWWGPYMYISAPGQYEVTFWLKTNGTYSGRIMDVDSGVFPVVVSADTRISSVSGSYETLDLTTSNIPEKNFPTRPIYGENLTASKYTPITIKVEATVSGFYEFRGRNVTAPISIYLDKIDVSMKKPYAYTEPVYVKFGDYNPTTFDQKHVGSAIKLGTLINANSRLLLQQELFPFVVHPNSLALTFEGPQAKDYSLYVDNLLRTSDFVMLDWKANMTVASYVMSRLSHFPEFGVYGYQDNIALLKREYNSTPAFFEPTTSVYTLKDLHPQNGSIPFLDVNSTNGLVLLHNSTDPEFWWGPYVYLFPGEYTVTYRLKVANGNASNYFTLVLDHFGADLLQASSGSNSSLNLDYTGIKSVLTQRTVIDKDFPKDNTYYNITVRFVADKFGPYEFPGRAVNANIPIYLDQIRLELVKPYGSYQKEPGT
jgi:uncharacterized membrane protein